MMTTLHRRRPPDDYDRRPRSLDERPPLRPRLSAPAGEGLARPDGRLALMALLGMRPEGYAPVVGTNFRLVGKPNPGLARIRRMRGARGARAVGARLPLGRRREEPPDAGPLRARAARRRHARHRRAHRLQGRQRVPVHAARHGAGVEEDARNVPPAVLADLDEEGRLRPEARSGRGQAQPFARPTAFSQPARRARGLVARHRGLEAAVDAPVRADLGRVLPEADGEAGEVRGAEGRRLEDLGPHDGDAEEVRLELHEEVVRGGAAVDAQLARASRPASFSIARSTSALW